MNILLVIPGLSKTHNDIYSVYKKIEEQGHSVLVITQRISESKSGQKSFPKYENDNGIEIYRVFKSSSERTFRFWAKLNEINEIATVFKPDVVVCSQQSNMPLSLEIMRHFHIPLVLIVEFAYSKNNPSILTGTRNFRRIERIDNLYWNWLCRHSSAIITCNIGDQARSIDFTRYDTPVYCIPWPTGQSEIESTNEKKCEGRGIYVGAFTSNKNLEEFKITIPNIIENTPTTEFYIIGNGRYGKTVEDLKKVYPHQIKHIDFLPMNEVISLISSSYYSYVPSIWGSWGFILDSWRMKTPIIATHNHYNFNDEIDTKLTNPLNIADAINKLYMDRPLYEKIRINAYKRVMENHNPKIIASEYITVLENALKSKKSYS